MGNDFTDLQVSVAIFGCIFGAAIAGMLLRPFLRDYHLTDNSKDILKAARGIVVGLTALTLGLLVASSHSSFETKAKELKTQATNAILLDRVLTDFGARANPAKAELREVLLNEIKRIDQAALPGVDVRKQIGGASMEGLRPELLKLGQGSQHDAWLKTTALTLGQDILASRWRVYEELSSSIQWPLVYMLVFWLVGIFFSLGLVAPNNLIATGGLLVSSTALAGAVFLMLEMDTPYEGLITISTQPLQSAIDQLSDAQVTDLGSH